MGRRWQVQVGSLVHDRLGSRIGMHPNGGSSLAYSTSRTLFALRGRGRRDRLSRLESRPARTDLGERAVLSPCWGPAKWTGCRSGTRRRSGPCPRVDGGKGCHLPSECGWSHAEIWPSSVMHGKPGQALVGLALAPECRRGHGALSAASPTAGSTSSGYAGLWSAFRCRSRRNGRVPWPWTFPHGCGWTPRRVRTARQPGQGHTRWCRLAIGAALETGRTSRTHCWMLSGLSSARMSQRWTTAQIGESCSASSPPSVTVQA